MGVYWSHLHTIGKWILYTINVETFDWSTKARVGKAIFSGMRRHHNVKCFNFCRKWHLRSNNRKVISRKNDSSRYGINRSVQSSVKYMRNKWWHWPNKCRLIKDRQEIMIHWDTHWGALTGSNVKKISVNPSHVENIDHQEN